MTMVYYFPNLKFLNKNIVNGKEKNVSMEFFTGKLTSEILEIHGMCQVMENMVIPDWVEHLMLSLIYEK